MNDKKEDEKIYDLYGIKRVEVASQKSVTVVTILDIVTMATVVYLFGGKYIDYVKDYYAENGLNIPLLLFVVVAPILTFAIINTVFFIIFCTKPLKSEAKES